MDGALVPTRDHTVAEYRPTLRTRSKILYGTGLEVGCRRWCAGGLAPVLGWWRPGTLRRQSRRLGVVGFLTAKHGSAEVFAVRDDQTGADVRAIAQHGGVVALLG